MERGHQRLAAPAVPGWGVLHSVRPGDQAAQRGGAARQVPSQRRPPRRRRLGERDLAVDITYVLYECEEVDQRHNGLSRLGHERPDLLRGEAAILAEPTGGQVEAGCQGTLRAVVAVTGERAHTARPWMGVNAVHRLAPVLSAVAGYQERRPVIGGCEYRESLQAVAVDGAVAGNVVPDRARLVLNHRFAPDRGVEEAVASLQELLGPALDTDGGDTSEVESVSLPAPPAL